MTDITWIAPLLLTLRGCCHFLIFLRVATYTKDGSAKHRKIVGFCAALFAGANLAESIRIASNFYDYVGNVEPYLPVIMIFVLVFVTWSGGNIAKFLPRKILERLP